MFHSLSLFSLFQGNFGCQDSKLKSVIIKDIDFAKGCPNPKHWRILKSNVHVSCEVTAWRSCLWTLVSSLCVKSLSMPTTVSCITLFTFNMTTCWPNACLPFKLRWMTSYEKKWLRQLNIIDNLANAFEIVFYPPLNDSIYIWSLFLLSQSQNIVVLLPLPMMLSLVPILGKCGLCYSVHYRIYIGVQFLCSFYDLILIMDFFIQLV